jgi:hypothetical protein
MLLDELKLQERLAAQAEAEKKLQDQDQFFLMFMET